MSPMLTAIRKKLGRMGVLLTLLLGLFAAAPSLDAWACQSDETAPVSLAAVPAATTPAENPRDAGSQHRCYCAGHCCPAGVAVEASGNLVHRVAASVAQPVTTTEAVVRQAPPALERPPRI